MQFGDLNVILNQYHALTSREKQNGGLSVSVCYKKLWKLLIDRDMKKKDLQRVAGISAASITKLGKNENISTEIIQKICVALQCDVSDIMEMVEDKTN